MPDSLSQGDGESPEWPQWLSLYDPLRKIARRVAAGRPAPLRLIFRSKRKSDRVDAEKPAKLLFLGEIPAA